MTLTWRHIINRNTICFLIKTSIFRYDPLKSLNQRDTIINISTVWVAIKKGLGTQMNTFLKITVLKAKPNQISVFSFLFQQENPVKYLFILCCNNLRNWGLTFCTIVFYFYCFSEPHKYSKDPNWLSLQLALRVLLQNGPILCRSAWAYWPHCF